MDWKGFLVSLSGSKYETDDLFLSFCGIVNFIARVGIGSISRNVCSESSLRTSNVTHRQLDNVFIDIQ